MNGASTESAARAPGPGAQLRQARADLHLTHEEVAAKLHLAARQIQALEQDDYSSLPGATYVRGYLKSYALLLGLAPGPVLDAHARLTAAPVVPSLGTIAPRKEITSRHHQVRFVTYIVAFLVIGLALAWWQSRDTRPPNPLLTARDAEPAIPETVPAVDAPATAGMPAEETPPGVPSTGLRTGVLATPVPAPAAVPAAPPPVAVAPPPAVPAALPAGPRVNLVLHTDQDSWADIRDARQVKLLYETVPAGRTVTLEGVAPLSIFLGNAAGVRLDYNGQAVDVGQHRRGMMARFTLGGSEAAVAPP